MSDQNPPSSHLNRSIQANDDVLTSAYAGVARILPETLLANDHDIDGDNIRGAHLLNAVNGTVYWDGSHVVFVGNPGYNGPASFEYIITDDNGGYDTATVNLNIVPNTPPTAVNDMLESIANGAITISPESLLANDYDLDGDAIEGIGIQDAVNGVVTWDGTNVIFTSDDGYTGPASFTYTITDNNGGTSTATVNLNILANRNPDAQDDEITATENNIVFIQAETLLANDTDLDGDTLTGVSIQDEVNGKVFWDGTQVIFIPDNDYYGPASFTYTITDGRGAIDTATVNLNIIAQQETEGLHADGDYIISKTEGAFTIDSEILLVGNRLVNTDEGEGLTILSVQDAMFGSVLLNADGNVFFTPKLGYKGPAAFSYTVEDINGARDTAIVNIEIDSPLEITVESGYGQSDAVITRNATNTPLDLLSEAQNGEVEEIYTPNLFASGTNYIVYSPNDGYVGADSFEYAERNYSIEYRSYVHTIGTAIIDVKENLAPEGIEDNLHTSTNSPLVTPTAILLANDIEPENQIMTVLSVQDAVNGQVILDNGNAVFTPTQGFVGEASYTYTLADNRGNTDTQSVNVLVSNTPVTPLTDGNEQNNLAEGSQLIVEVNSADNLLNNANHPDAVITGFSVGDSPITYRVDTPHEITLGTSNQTTSWGTSFQTREWGNIQINNDGSYQVSFSGYSNFNGDFPTINYTVNSGGQSVTSSLDLSISPVNDDPKVINMTNELWVGNEERYLITTTDALIADYASDVDGDLLTITAVESDGNGTVELIGNNIYFTPNAGYSGDATFDYTVSDGNGGTATGTYLIEVLTGSLIGADDDQVTVGNKELISIPISALVDNDYVYNRGFLTEASFTSVQDATNGSVIIDGDNVVFTPAAGHTGSASFSYTLSHLGVSKTAIVNLSIGEDNTDAPNILVDDVIQSNSITTRYPITLESLTSNDEVSSNDYTFNGFNAQNGSVEREYSSFYGTVYFDGFYFYKEGINAETFAFDYLINDGEGNISIATAHLDLIANQPPVAQGETLYTLSNNMTLANRFLLANDNDPEFDNINLVSTQNAVGGIVSFDAEQVTFALDGSSENTSFQYSIDDSRGNYDFAQVDVIQQEGLDLIGTDSTEILYGNAQDNTITANGGDDTIIGGKGNDTLTGGLGADVFVWSLTDTEPNQVAVDRITDFDVNKDTIDIKDLIEFDTALTLITGQTKLDVFVDIEVENGDTALNIRNTQGADIIQTIMLEGVALEADYNTTPPFLVTNDSRILYTFENNFIYD